MPGPPPIPNKLKVIRGTMKETRRILNEMDFQPMVRVPMSPKHLDKRAKKEWRTVCKNLIAIKMLYLVDLPQLQSYCFQVSMMQQAEVALAEGKLIETLTNNDGHQYKAKNKWISIYNESLDRVNKLGREFGFSPSARTRISMINPGQDELDDKYLGTG